MRRLAWVFVSAFAVASCSRVPDEQTPDLPSNGASAVATVSTTEANEAVRRSDSVDVTSPEAAKRLVQEFAFLLEHRRFGEAYDIINGPSLDWKRSEFIGEFSVMENLRTEVGPPSRPEGAAGSVYVSVPVSVSGRLQNGQIVKDAYLATLRRVNDVPGSTEAQRRWHIERIERKT